MGNYKIKSIWKQDGGSSSTLGPRVEALELSQEQQNTSIETNANSITTLQTDLGDLGNQVVDLNNAAVKTSGNQSISGTKTFNNGIKVINANQANGFIVAGKLELGYGSQIGYITSDDASNKILKFGGVSGRGRFNLDLENTSKIINVPNPTNNSDIVNKSYVDNKVGGPSLIGELNSGGILTNESINVPTLNTNYPIYFVIDITWNDSTKSTFYKTIFSVPNNNWFQLIYSNKTASSASATSTIFYMWSQYENNSFKFSSYGSLRTLDINIKIYGTPNS